MSEWWNSLSQLQQIFYGIGIIALLVTIIQTLLTLLGVGGDSLDIDVDFDAGDTDHSSGVGFFSMQTLSAFFLSFGWTGVTCLSYQAPTWVTIVIALVVGGIFMTAVYLLIRGMLKLQGKGNLEYASAIGEVGTVYVTIPGDDQDGGGQIQVNIQGRLTTASARKKSQGALIPGDQVKIVGLLGATTFMVEKP